MSVRLFPRLKDAGVARCLEDLERSSAVGEQVMPVERRLEEYTPWIWLAPSGGSPDAKLVKSLRDEAVEIAIRHGYPDKVSDIEKSAFDVEAAKWLATDLQLVSPELLRDDVWAFISSVLLQEVVVWRYSVGQRARFFGGVRNTFQRLWMRGRTLDLGETAGEGRWRLLEGLSEDAMVQIFERASLASDARLARAIATGWLDMADEIGRGRMEPVMRRATKLLRLRNQIRDLGRLPIETLRQEIWGAFERAASGLQRR